mmetsp:Transcript_45519/g.83330  ORF Transcript_45519/g.83330 Transcript_45519/m.83330 type:complete len:218 (-) Transcript_45519:496-1149(-)
MPPSFRRQSAEWSLADCCQEFLKTCCTCAPHAKSAPIKILSNLSNQSATCHRLRAKSAIAVRDTIADCAKSPDHLNRWHGSSAQVVVSDNACLAASPNRCANPFRASLGHSTNCSTIANWKCTILARAKCSTPESLVLHPPRGHLLLQAAWPTTRHVYWNCRLLALQHVGTNVHVHGSCYPHRACGIESSTNLQTLHRCARGTGKASACNVSFPLRC